MTAETEETDQNLPECEEGDLPVHPLPRGAKAWPQVLAALGSGVGVGLGIAFATSLSLFYAMLIGWDAAVIVYLSWVWWVSWHLDAEGTAESAVHEDPTRVVADLILLVAAVASLVAVGFTIADASQANGLAKFLEVALGIVSIVCSWFLIHTVFTIRYARLYYIDQDGGIEFNMNRPPIWSDFAYVAFTIGMTFQISDTDLHTSTLRRLALRHMFLSYLFGAVIIAVLINTVAGLGK